MGVAVEIFTAPVLFREYYNKGGLGRKVLFRLGLSNIYKVINDQLKQWIENHGPDVLWVFKGMEVLPSTLQWARERKIKFVNYNPDNPFIFSGKGSGNSNVTKSIDLYDLHFTYHTEVKEQLMKRTKSKVAMLPFGFDIDEKVYQRLVGEEEILEVCFLGNPDEERINFIVGLAGREIPISVYGHDWNKHLKPHKNIVIHPPVYGEDQWRVLRKYRVQLNLMRPHNIHSHNMRTFEVPAIGGIMLAPDTIDHRFFFQDGEECFLFKDVEQATQQANKILRLSFDEAATVRQAARNRSVDSGYSYFSRTQQALSEMKKLYA